jgi:hypothetical protein
VVAIAGIGFFLHLDLFLGLGAMTNSTDNPLDNNNVRPALGPVVRHLPLAMISAIAVATVCWER